MALVAKDGALAFCTDTRYLPCPPPAELAEAGVPREPAGWLRGRLRGSELGRCLNAVREAEQEGIGRVAVVDTDGVVRRVTVVNLIESHDVYVWVVSERSFRACDLLKLRVSDVSVGGRVGSRAIILQRKTQRQVHFEITARTRESLADWIGFAGLDSPA